MVMEVLWFFLGGCYSFDDDTMHNKGPLYTACHDRSFTILPFNYFCLDVGVLSDHPLVCQLPSHHHLLVLALPLSITRQRKLFCLLVHRVILIHHSVGILSYYPSWHAPSGSNSSFPLLGGMSSQRTFPPKEFEWEPQNRLSLLTTARLYLLLPLTHDSPLLYWLGIGWWCLGFVCAPLLCMSKACLLLMHFHGLETHMCILSLILDLLWRELFSNPPFFMVCFLQGLSLAWLWDFLSFSLLFAPFVGLLVFLPCHPAIPVVVLFDPWLLGLFGACYMFFSQLVKMT